MFVIRQYSTENDELRKQLRLGLIDDGDLADALASPPARHGSTPLPLPVLQRLAERFSFAVPEDQNVEYFLDFDAEPAVRAWEPAGAAASTR
jgi:hypothetical protein